MIALSLSRIRCTACSSFCCSRKIVLALTKFPYRIELSGSFDLNCSGDRSGDADLLLSYGRLVDKFKNLGTLAENLGVDIDDGCISSVPHTGSYGRDREVTSR